jgi:hypothetical protein
VKISNKFFSFFSSLNQYFPHIPYVASKKLNTSEVMAEKSFLTNPLGEWRHLVTKCKKFFRNFLPFLTPTQVLLLSD